MSSDRDLYEVLGVSRGASPEEIRRAFRSLARKHHPDVSKAPDAAKRFAEINEAYEVLSDPEKRAQYDRFGRVGVGAAGPGPRPGGAGVRDPFAGFRAGGADAEDLGSIFDELFGGAGTPFGRRAAHAPPRRGRDVEQPVRVPFLTAARGGTITVPLPGRGRSATIEVRVPAGAEDGARLRVPAHGEASAVGGEAGDLLLVIEVEPRPGWKREGLDVLVEVPISIVEATLGGEVPVPLLEGGATVRIPPGTASGQRLRLRGKGIRAADGRFGDLHAVVKIVPPSEVDPESARLLRALAERLPDPRRGGSAGA